jgi:hypothetical protein
MFCRHETTGKILKYPEHRCSKKNKKRLRNGSAQTRWFSMFGQSNNVSFRLQSLQPKLRLRPVIFFGACVAFLACMSYLEPEPERAAYGLLAASGSIVLIVQYYRESSLVKNRLPAVGIVTDYRVRGKGVPHFGKGVPVIKYEFIAFDQKAYHGETGWGAAGLNKGSQIAILYNPENPARSHPLNGFLFYSFH